MFKGSTYQVIEREEGEKGTRFRVGLNEKDPLFEGHFPGQPVLPGACVLEFGRELLEEMTGNPLHLFRIKNMKIPAMVDPREFPELSFEFDKKGEGPHFSCSYTVFHGDTVFFKFKGEFGVREEA